MDLANKVRMRREQLGWTQDELAKRMGYASRVSINKIENGRPVSQKIIVRLATALETTPAWLMGWEDDDPQLNKEEIKKKLTAIGELPDYIQAFIDLLQGVTEEQAGQLLQLIKLFLGHEK